MALGNFGPQFTIDFQIMDKEMVLKNAFISLSLTVILSYLTYSDVTKLYFLWILPFKQS